MAVAGSTTRTISCRSRIAAALARNIVSPFGRWRTHAKADELPDSVKPLVRRNAVEVRKHTSSRCRALTNKVREALKDAPRVLRWWPFVASAAARLIAPGRWHIVAGSATALLLVGWIGLYQIGVPVWVRDAEAEQPDRLGGQARGGR